jgi:chromosome segregation ATPase
MARLGITYQDVTKAIAELQGKDKNPTVDSIREILGTGSKSTIARLLREWRSKHSIQTDDDASIPSELLLMIKGLWERLQEKGDARITEHQQQADAKVALLQEQLRLAVTRESELHSSCQHLNKKLAHSDEEKKRTNTTLLDQKQKTAVLIEQAKSLETRREESAAENIRLHQVMKQSQDNLEQCHVATKQLQQTQRSTIENIQQEHQRQLSKLQIQHDKIMQKNSEQKIQYNKLSKTHQVLSNKCSTIAEQYTASQQQYKSLNNTHMEIKTLLNQQLEAGQLITRNLQCDFKASKEQIKPLKKTIAETRHTLDALEDKYQISLQQKAHLEGQVTQLHTLLEQLRQEKTGKQL